MEIRGSVIKDMSAKKNEIIPDVNALHDASSDSSAIQVMRKICCTCVHSSGFLISFLAKGFA